MTQIELNNQALKGEKRRADERHKSQRFYLGLLNYWRVEFIKKKCISFIIWVTALPYNEMLINWPLFISLVICRFTLIILLFHLKLTASRFYIAVLEIHNLLEKFSVANSNSGSGTH